MKVSFEYLEVLEKTVYQRLARALVEAGVDVYVITDAEPTENNIATLLAITSFCKIDQTKILFTDGAYAATIIKQLRIDLHYEDRPDHVRVLQLLTNTKIASPRLHDRS